MEKKETTTLQLLSPPDDGSISLLDIVPEYFIKYIEKIPQEYLSMGEEELREICFPVERNKCSKPESYYSVDQQIRTLFWIEHELAITQRRRMVAANIYSGVMHGPNFTSRVLRNPKRLAWMLLPFHSHVADVNLLLKRSSDRLKEVLEMPLTSQVCRCRWKCLCINFKKEVFHCLCKDGCKCPVVFDVKAGELMLKIYEKAELRARGSVPQVGNQESLIM